MTAFFAQVSTLALIVAAGCGARDRRTPDDTVVVLVSERINNLDPRYTETALDVTLSRLVAPGLTTIETPSLEPRLLLAESIQINEKTIDVVLRPGLRFSDGGPVTAEDVAFTFQSMLDPAMKSPFQRNIRERFKLVEVRGERAVRFHLEKPIATIMTDFDLGIVSARAAGPSGRFRAGRIVGAGPVMVESFDAEDLLLRRSPTWTLGRSPIEKVRVRTVRDQNARALMLVGGSADLSQNGIRPDLIDDMGENDRVQLASGAGARLTYLMLNGRDPILRDVRVRRAIAYAIDRDRVLRSKLDGRAVLATGLLAPGHWAYNADVARYPHDPARAMALLDEAGYPDPDGRGGRPRLSLSFKTSSDQFRVALARIWASQLAEVGIAVNVQSFEFGTVLADYKKGNYQIGSLQTATISEPDFLYAYFSSTRIPTTAEPNLLNRWRYASSRVDELTESGRRTLDREKRRAIYGEAQAILATDLPIVPLWHEHNVAVMNRDLRGFELFPTANLWGLVPAVKQR
jgi:peptide/nickel transport system substrate-binding protein